MFCSTAPHFLSVIYYCCNLFVFKVFIMSIVLIGDSIFRRLYNSFPAGFDSVSSKFCVSGATVQQLWALVKLYRTDLVGKSLVVLVGTNNFTKGQPVSEICRFYRSFIRYLKRLSPKVFLVEVLPIPRLEQLATALANVLSFNKYIRSFEPSGCTVIHVHDKFVFEETGKSKISLFVSKLKSGRVDLVHPNCVGLRVLYKLLGEHFPSLLDFLCV